MKLLDLAKIDWETFPYNYKWSSYRRYIDGWIPKFAFFVPLIGYLLLFNDQVAETLNFTKMTTNESDAFGISGIVRLRFIYFGLIALGISNLLFNFRKPFVFRLGVTTEEYTKRGLEYFTYSDYLEIRGTMNTKGRLTVNANNYDNEWDSFSNIAVGGNGRTKNANFVAHWEDAKKKHGNLLRSLLQENFFRYDRGKRGSLTVCLILSTFGYIMLIIPSGDLFIKVVRSIF